MDMGTALTCYPVDGDTFASHNAFLDDELSLCEVTPDARDSACLVVHPVDVPRLYRQTRALNQCRHDRCLHITLLYNIYFKALHSYINVLLCCYTYMLQCWCHDSTCKTVTHCIPFLGASHLYTLYFCILYFCYTSNTLHFYVTLPYTTFHYITLLCYTSNTLHFYITLPYTTFPYITLLLHFQYITLLCYTSIHYISIHYTSTHYTSMLCFDTSHFSK